MKTFRIIAFLLFILILTGIVLSCSYESQTRTGSLVIPLPSLTEISKYGTKALYTSSATYYARVYLVYNEAILPLKVESDYVEVQLEEDTTQAIVRNVPAAEDYYVWVAIGTKANPESPFDVQYYNEQWNEQVDVIAGNDNEFDFTFTESPFDNIAFTDRIFTATKNAVYSGNYTNPNLTMTKDTQDLSAYTINSIERGYDYGGSYNPCLFISTTQNIIKWVADSTFTLDFSVLLGQKNILRSLAYTDSSTVSVYFQSDGGLGGLDQDSPTPGNDWVFVDFSRYFKGELILDFVETKTATFFTTQIGAFGLPTNFLSENKGSQKVSYLRYAQFLEVKKDDTQIPILSLGFDEASTPDRLYIGTNRGLWYANIDTGINAHKLSNTPSIYDDKTEKHKIFNITINPINAAYKAYASRIYLFYEEPVEGFAYLPFVAGVPGEITGMVWNEADNSLIISGTKGFVVLPMS